MTSNADDRPAGKIQPGELRVRQALQDLGLDYRRTEHGRVGSLAEAAAARGIEPRQLIKTLVVRRAADDYLFVLVPGDREISWPKLRHHLGVNRISMPDAATALEVTGYERGTITPLGSVQALPVFADERIDGTISLGAGAHGVGVSVDSGALFCALGAERADLSIPLEA